jgi:hypothetical protein
MEGHLVPQYKPVGHMRPPPIPALPRCVADRIKSVLRRIPPKIPSTGRPPGVASPRSSKRTSESSTEYCPAILKTGHGSAAVRPSMMRPSLPSLCLCWNYSQWAAQ